MGNHPLLQGIFLTQGLNPGLPHCRQMLYHLSHQGRVLTRTTVQKHQFFVSLLYGSTLTFVGLPCGSAGKESAHKAGDLSSLPGWEDPLEKRKATHSSILAWRVPWTTVHGVAKSGTQLSDFHLSHPYMTAAAAKSLQSCSTLCDPKDSSPPGFPVPGVLQARTLEWVAISFSNA